MDKYQTKSSYFTVFYSAFANLYFLEVHSLQLFHISSPLSLIFCYFLLKNLCDFGQPFDSFRKGRNLTIFTLLKPGKLGFEVFILLSEVFVFVLKLIGTYDVSFSGFHDSIRAHWALLHNFFLEDSWFFD